MYKETLRGIAGIGLFPVVSLLLFVTVFVLALFRAVRMDRTDVEQIAALPLDGADALAASRQEL
jgi:cytochrome c oxidase cbb3-type subunit IV